MQRQDEERARQRRKQERERRKKPDLVADPVVYEALGVSPAEAEEWTAYDRKVLACIARLRQML